MLRMAVVIAALLATGGSETYRVTLTRIDKDLYRDDPSKVIIQTKYCYEYAIGAPAILNWEGRYGNNFVTFIDSKTHCDVVALR